MLVRVLHRPYFLLFCLCLLFSLKCYGAEATKPIEFVIVVPSYNNEKWCLKNLQSIFNQTYPHFTVHYINDCSTDATKELVDGFINDNGLGPKSVITHNSTRRGAMANLYTAIHEIAPGKVVVAVDGDDFLAHDRVLELLARVYQDTTVWMTHGNYLTEPFTKTSYCKAYSQKVMKKRAFRRQRLYMGCQLRTFYAKLFHLINQNDLMWKGAYLPTTYDLAMMFPMLEMASQGHIQFIKEPIYIVNTANPISDNKQRLQLQQQLDRRLRRMPLYKPLKQLF